MTNNEYQNMAMTQYMLREFQQQRKEKAIAETVAEEQDGMQYEQFDGNVLAYPIFTNHACGYQKAEELLEVNQESDYYRRWAFFFTPDPEQLPHHDYRQQLEIQLVKLKHRLRTLSAPRLAVFAIAVCIVIALVMREHYLLPILPILATAWYWYHSIVTEQKTQHTLVEHIDHMEAFANHQADIQEQLDSLPAPVPFTQLQENYHQAVKELLRHTLLQLLPPHATGDLSRVLEDKQWEGFILESWGYLQITLPAQKDSVIKDNLLQADNFKQSAIQTILHQNRKIDVYRLQYLHIWILTPSGLLMGYGYYDRVAKRFLHEDHEFYPFSELKHAHAVDEVLPEQATLKKHLEKTVYRKYFQQPVHVLSLSTITGQNFECALTSGEHAIQQNFWLDHYGLSTNMDKLTRRLYEKLYGDTRPAVSRP